MEVYRTAGVVPDVIDEVPSKILKYISASGPRNTKDVSAILRSQTNTDLTPLQWFDKPFQGDEHHYVSWDGQLLNPGDIRTPRQVKDVPQVSYEAEDGAFYTLICSDPDAPSRADPKFGQFQHWLVTNIAGNDVNKGDELTAYIGSGAPKGTGLHRYVFLLYRQTTGKIDFSHLKKIPNNTADGRRLQNAKEFATTYKLQLEAANFYQAEWDDYVPTVHAQLGLGKK